MYAYSGMQYDVSVFLHKGVFEIINKMKNRKYHCRNSSKI